MSSFSRQEPKQQIVKGRELKCPVCGNTHFRFKRVLMNTVGMSFLNLDWSNRRADCYICSECGHVLWFFGETS